MLNFGTHGILNSISTSLEHPIVSTLSEHPKHGCSNEVLFLAFLTLKMALKVNYDLKFEICGLCLLCWYSHISHLGLFWPLLTTFLEEEHENHNYYTCVAAGKNSDTISIKSL